MRVETSEERVRLLYLRNADTSTFMPAEHALQNYENVCGLMQYQTSTTEAWYIRSVQTYEPGDRLFLIVCAFNVYMLSY